MSIELDYGQALVYLEKAVGEKGADFIYSPLVTRGEDDYEETACMYFNQGQPSCIVGHVMSYMGINEAAEQEGTFASMALKNLGITFTDEETEQLLNMVQEEQDGGASWGEALRRAQGFADV